MSGKRAYTLQSSPEPVTTPVPTTPVFVELTWQQKAQVWLSDDQNVSLYIIMPTFVMVFGGCILLYITHRLRRLYRRHKRRQRAARKAIKLEKSPIIEEDDDVQSGSRRPVKKQFKYHDAGSNANSTPDSSSVKISPAVTWSQPGMVPSQTRLQSISSIRTLPAMSTSQATPQSRKKIVSISTKCKCEGSVHQPGCAQFALPDIKTVLKSSGYDEMNSSSAIREAMEKVAKYEQELKNNPEMRMLLQRYRQMKEEKNKKSADENWAKGNWQKVPISILLERKKQMRDSGRYSYNL